MAQLIGLDGNLSSWVEGGMRDELGDGHLMSPYIYGCS